MYDIVFDLFKRKEKTRTQPKELLLVSCLSGLQQACKVTNWPRYIVVQVCSAASETFLINARCHLPIPGHGRDTHVTSTSLLHLHFSIGIMQKSFTALQSNTHNYNGNRMNICQAPSIIEVRFTKTKRPRQQSD